MELRNDHIKNEIFTNNNQHYDREKSVSAPNNQELTPIRPVKLFKNMRTSYLKEESKGNAHQYQNRDHEEAARDETLETISSKTFESSPAPPPFSQMSRVDMNTSDPDQLTTNPMVISNRTRDEKIPTTSHGLITPSSASQSVHKQQLPQKRSYEFSEEADYFLNQIVCLLAHFRSLGKSGFDQAIHLEMELKLERENLNQQISLMNLERQSKNAMSEEIKSLRTNINDLRMR